MGIEKPLGKQKMWRPMGVKSHWGIPKNVETNGGEKPLGNPKKTKCGDLWLGPGP